MKFVLVYIPGTDEEPVIESNLTKQEVRTLVLDLQLCRSDYAIIKGSVVKGFA